MRSHEKGCRRGTKPSSAHSLSVTASFENVLRHGDPLSRIGRTSGMANRQILSLQIVAQNLVLSAAPVGSRFHQEGWAPSSTRVQRASIFFFFMEMEGRGDEQTSHSFWVQERSCLICLVSIAPLKRFLSMELVCHKHACEGQRLRQFCRNCRNMPNFAGTTLENEKLVMGQTFFRLSRGPWPHGHFSDPLQCPPPNPVCVSQPCP